MDWSFVRAALFLCACLAAFPPASLHAQGAGRDSASVPEEGTYEMSAVEVLPRLRNAREVTRSIAALYPPELRDAGIGGVVELRYRILPTGRPDPATISIVSSADARLDEAARQVVRGMVFAPAQTRDRPVAVWVTQPLTFMVQTPAPAPAQPER